MRNPGVFAGIGSGKISRKRAFFTHLSASVMVVSAVLAVVFLSWYPGDYFTVAGAWSAVQILIFVDVVLGPSLTLLLFKPGKKGLWFDMSVILLIQIGALIYGVSVIHQERPYFLVFAVDRFEMISEHEVDLNDLSYDSLKVRPVDDLVYVYARRPQDPEEYQKYFDSVLIEGAPDIERRPEYWEPYSEAGDEPVLRARPVDDLRSFEHADAALIDRVIARYGTEHADIGFLPIIGKRSDFSMLIDLQSAELLGIVNIFPWEEYIAPEERGLFDSLLGLGTDDADDEVTNDAK